MLLLYSRLQVQSKLSCTVPLSTRLLLTNHQSMALVVDPIKWRCSTEGIRQLQQGQVNPRISLELGISDNDDFMTCAIRWTSDPDARQKTPLGILTMQDVLRALLGRAVFDPPDSQSQRRLLLPNSNEWLPPYPALTATQSQSTNSSDLSGTTAAALSPLEELDPNDMNFPEVTNQDAAEDVESWKSFSSADDLRPCCPAGPSAMEDTRARCFSFEGSPDEKSFSTADSLRLSCYAASSSMEDRRARCFSFEGSPDEKDVPFLLSKSLR